MEGTPPGDALPPPPWRGTPARKGARCGAGAWSPHPHRPPPGNTGRGTPAARSRGRAAGRGTAPDIRRPSQRWQATPPWDGPPQPPQHADPTGHTGQGDSVGPPHPHTRAHSTWVADPNSPPSGRAVAGGTAPDLRRPSQWWKAPSLGTPLRHPDSEQRWPARAHAVGPVLGRHARNDRTRDTRVVEPWLPAPENGRPGEGQRLTPDTPHNGGRPPPPGTAPHHHPCGTGPPQGMQAKGTVLGPHTHTPGPTARGWRTPTARPVGGQSGEGPRLDSDAPHNGGRHPPRGRPFRQPHSEQRRPARAHAVGLVLGLHARTDRTRDTRVAEPWLPAPEDGRPGEGQRLTPDAPHNSGRPAPPGTAPHQPRGTQPPQGIQAKGTVLGPHTHTPTPTARGWRTPTARLVGGQSGEGKRLTSDAPHTMVEGTPPGDALPPPPQRATPARKGECCRAGAGSPRPHRPHPGHTNRGTPATRSRGQDAEGEQPLTPDAPEIGGRHPPRGRPSANPTTSNAPTHQRTSHGKSAPHPLLLGTATQQWRNPRPHAKHAPDLRRWTQHTRSSGRWDSGAAKETPHKGTRARTPTWRKYRSPPREARPRKCAAGGQHAHPLPRVETGPLHRRRPVPQTAPSAGPR